jgi:hypothetical protein
MSIVDKPVEDCVCQGRVADGLVPVVNRQLAGDDCRSASVAVFKDFQQVSALCGGEHGQPPIIEDQDVGLGVDKTWGSCGASAVCDFQATVENGGPCDGNSVSPFW